MAVDLTLPLDIPWQLLSRRGPDTPEDPTSLATFVYVPILPELDAAYPDDRLVYFKFTASVFPFRLDVPSEPPFGVLDEAIAPVWRMVLDVEITSRETPPSSEFKPYFLSAAPTRRAIIETGVVGDYVTEGESDEVAVARSGSHLIEGFHSTTKTRKFGIGGALGGLVGGFLPIGGALSYSRGNTSISGGREVTEQLDTTNRQSSEERKELLSHMTNVNNVLTLLSGSLVGTDNLRFSLWPQPLRPLSVDPNDENLWYAELLKRRSSGIEGMQDFYAVAVIPRGEGFCLAENLRRVSVLEPPLPEPPVQPSVLFDEFTFDWNDFTTVFIYLTGKYPQGTPLEELDVSVEDRLVPDPGPPFPSSPTRATLQAWYNAVGAFWVPNPLSPLPAYAGQFEPQVLLAWSNHAKDIIAALTAKIEAMPRPVVWGWTFWDWPFTDTEAPNMLRLHALTAPRSLPIPYKWVQDVWLEAVQYDYESELAKSPLERGTVLVNNRGIDICADMDKEGVISGVKTTRPSAPWTGVLPDFPMKPVFPSWSAARFPDTRTKGRGVVSGWGILEAQLGSRISGASEATAAPFSFQDPRLLEIFLRRAARLAKTDKRNQPLAEISRRFQLSAAEVRLLKEKGVTNLSSLASSILAAREIDRLTPMPPMLRDKQPADAIIKRALPPSVAKALVSSIGKVLDDSYQKHDRSRPPSRRAHQHNTRRGKKG